MYHIIYIHIHILYCMCNYIVLNYNSTLINCQNFHFLLNALSCTGCFFAWPGCAGRLGGVESPPPHTGGRADPPTHHNAHHGKIWPKNRHPPPLRERVGGVVEPLPTNHGGCELPYSPKKLSTLPADRSHSGQHPGRAKDAEADVHGVAHLHSLRPLIIPDEQPEA